MSRAIQTIWWQGKAAFMIVFALAVAVLLASPFVAWADDAEEGTGGTIAVEDVVTADVQSEATSSEVELASEPEPKAEAEPTPDPVTEPVPKAEPKPTTVVVDEQPLATEDNEPQPGKPEAPAEDEGVSELPSATSGPTSTEPAEEAESEAPDADADDVECEAIAEDATAASAETDTNRGEDSASLAANANNDTVEVSASVETDALLEKSSSKVTLTTQSNQYWHLWSDGDPFTLGSNVVIRWEDVSSTVVFSYKVCVYDSKGASVFSKRYPNSGTYSSNASYAGSVSVPTTTSMPSGQWRAVIYFYNASGAQIDAPEVSFFVKDTPITFGTDNLSTHSVIAGDSTTLFVSVTGSNLIYEWYWNTDGSLTSGTKITGATSSSYTVSNIPYSFSGRYYYCRVSNYSGDANFNYIKIYGIGSAQFFVSKRKISVPTANTGLVYSGSALTGVASSASYTRSGAYSATNAGSYTAYVSLADSANCTWADGTTGSKSIYWKITRKSLDIPKARKNLTYNGYNHVGIEGYSMTGSIGASSPYSTSGTTHAINAGSYSATLTLSDVANYQWSDGTTTQKKISWSIARKQLDSPTVYRNLVYNGKKQDGVVYGADYTLTTDWYGWSSTMRNAVIVLGGKSKPGYVLSGVCSAQNAGSYTAYATLDDANNFQWANGTTGKSVIKWKIAPLSIAKAVVSGVKNKTYTGKVQGQNPTVKVGGLTATRSLSYKNNVNAGTATVTITGTGNYTGSIAKTFKIAARSIAKAVVSGIKNKTYTGKALKQSPSVRLSGYAPTFKVSYKKNINVGKASMVITGTGNYTGSIAKTFKIKPAKLAASGIALAKTSVAYTGKAVKPKVTVKAGSKKLKAGKDYTVVYAKDSKAVGSHKVKVVGKGNYAGTASKSYVVNPKATAITKVRAYEAAYDALVGGGIEVSWNKVPAQIDGYEVWLSTSKKFPSSGLKKKQFDATSAQGKKASFKGKGLKKDTQYYVKIRTYKKAGSKTYLSAWSKVKGVRTEV